MSKSESIFSRGIDRFVAEHEELQRELEWLCSGRAWKLEVDPRALRYAAIVRAYRLVAEEQGIEPRLLIMTLGCDTDEERQSCGVDPSVKLMRLPYHGGFVLPSGRAAVAKSGTSGPGNR
jgi:hypothetical protein